MGLGNFLKKGLTAPIKLASAPVKRTISSTKDLARGNVKGAVSQLNLAKPSNIKAGVKAFRSYADPLAPEKRKQKPKEKPLAKPTLTDTGMEY